MRQPNDVYTAMNGKVIDLTVGGLAYFIVPCIHTGLEGRGGALPTWINFKPSISMSRMKLPIHSQSAPVQPLQFRDGCVISSHTF